MPPETRATAPDGPDHMHSILTLSAAPSSRSLAARLLAFYITTAGLGLSAACGHSDPDVSSVGGATAQAGAHSSGAGASSVGGTSSGGATGSAGSAAPAGAPSGGSDFG